MSGKSSSFVARGGIWALAQLALVLVAIALGPLTKDTWDLPWATGAGRALLLLSAAFAIGGFFALGRNLSPFPQPNANASQVRHGAYRLVRHPLYSSLILGSIGWALIWQSAASLATGLILALVLDGKSRVEERWLRQKFSDYDEYSRRVRRFIPWIY
jgi:protein-S-isoprenylcysteine O-methyltransferase Ste14